MRFTNGEPMAREHVHHREPDQAEHHVALEVERRVAGRRPAATRRSWRNRPSPRRPPAGTAWRCRGSSTRRIASRRSEAAASGRPSTRAAGIILRPLIPEPGRESARRAARSRGRRRSWRTPATAARRLPGCRRSHRPPRRPAPGCPSGAARTAPSRSAARGCAASPIRYAARHWTASASRRPLKPPPSALPPRITCTPPSNASIPRIAAATLVALESFTASTPPGSASSSSRCGTPAKDASAARIASRGTPWRRRPAPPPARSGGCARRAGAPGRGRTGPPGGPRASPRARASARTASSWPRGSAPGAVTVEVVGLDVQQHRALRSELGGVLELEARSTRRRPCVLAQRPRRARRAACPRCPPPRPASPRRARSRRAAPPWWSCRSSRSPRRTCSGSRRQASSSSPVTSMPALQGGGDHRRLARDARALDHAGHAVEQLDPVALQVELERGRRPPGWPSRRRSRRRGRRASARPRCPTAPAPPPGRAPVGAAASATLASENRACLGRSERAVLCTRASEDDGGEGSQPRVT